MKHNRWLLAIPFATYALSYVYLAFYHGHPWLWSTVIHEGGTLTLLETTLYASHFLGHVPSLTIIALIFAASFALFVKVPVPTTRERLHWITLSASFVFVCLIGSLWYFGSTETWNFIFQRQQSVTNYESGGSFLLHVPSTLSLLVLAPLYSAALFFLARSPISWNPQRLRWLLSAFACLIGFLFIITPAPLLALLTATTDPRYLAHSVRELATFPLTYFPLPAYLWLRKLSYVSSSPAIPASRFVILLSVLAVPLLAYQVLVPLSFGISDLAQRPSFACGNLPILYLLASHFFEHALDTVYFSLACFAFISPLVPRPRGVLPPVKM